MEAVRISETSVYFNETTRRCIPEGCHHPITQLIRITQKQRNQTNNNKNMSIGLLLK
jgi:hypothetical protein